MVENKESGAGLCQGWIVCMHTHKLVRKKRTKVPTSYSGYLNYWTEKMGKHGTSSSSAMEPTGLVWPSMFQHNQG